ncbi:MAG TPA: glycosyl transferase family 2, partial [Acidimicrobiaceae bacterium]|nr:glycosyl transferase family 2 [Acidimicrobiaceae bacterium]
GPAGVGAVGVGAVGGEAAGVEIVVVDDGSTDGTTAAAVAAGADLVVTLDSNAGKGAAVRAGMLAARGRVRIFTDVDLAYPPSQLPALVAALADGADVVVGNRRHRDTRRINSAPRARAVASRLFNLGARVVLLGRHRDTQCGLKAFTAPAARHIFARTAVDGFAFDVEVLYLAEAAGMKVVDAPVVLDHVEETTVALVPSAFAVLRDLLGIRRRIAAGGYDAPASTPATAPGPAR